jgi:hypothetical protein
MSRATATSGAATDATALQWNLFDIVAKFGDVEPLSAVLDYLRSNTIG